MQIDNSITTMGGFNEPDYGLRPDGTRKAGGFLGAIQNPDGTVSTELSIGVNIDGKETLIPLLVPTLTNDEIAYLQTNSDPKQIPDEIINKAVDHAVNRMRQGLSPFK